MLQKVKFAPGFNKQVTATGGESQWVNGDNVRFRYGTPEKIGGWAQLGSVEMSGRNTAIHHFVNTSGIKYAVLGTSSILYAYSGGIFYDIHPIKSTTSVSSAFSTTNGSSTVTITFSSAHNIGKGDVILCDNFSIPDLIEAVQISSGVYPIEASGGINEDNIIQYAETGVDFISIGSLTKDIRSIDLSLRFSD